MTDALARQQIQRWTTQLRRAGVRRRARLRAHLAHHRTGRSPWTSGPRPRSSARSASSGTSPRPRPRELDSPRRLGRALQAAPPAAALRARRPPRVQRPGRAAARRRGAWTARSALVAHVQLDESAHNRGVQVRVPGLSPRPRLRPRVGGSGGRAGDEHVGAAAGERPDRRAAGERRRPRDAGLLDAADAARDGDARASGTRLISPAAAFRLRRAWVGTAGRAAALRCRRGTGRGGARLWSLSVGGSTTPGACALAPTTPPCRRSGQLSRPVGGLLLW